MPSCQASLIVTPASLQKQWSDEITTRAPTLRVLLYEGKSNLMLPASASQTGNADKKNKRKADQMLPFDELGDAAIALWHTAAQSYDIIITTCEYRANLVQNPSFTLSKTKPCRLISTSPGRQSSGPGARPLIMRFTHAQEAPLYLWSEVLLLFCQYSMC